MVPISLFFWIVGEFSLYLALLHAWLGLPWPSALLGALGALVALVWP